MPETLTIADAVLSALHPQNRRTVPEIAYALRWKLTTVEIGAALEEGGSECLIL